MPAKRTICKVFPPKLNTFANSLTPPNPRLPPLQLRSVPRFSIIEFENRLDGMAKEPSNAEGERQAGVVFAGLNGVYGLTRHFELPGEVRLGPFIFSA